MRMQQLIITSTLKNPTGNSSMLVNQIHALTLQEYTRKHEYSKQHRTKQAYETEKLKSPHAKIRNRGHSARTEQELTAATPQLEPLNGIGEKPKPGNVPLTGSIRRKCLSQGMVYAGFQWIKRLVSPILIHQIVLYSNRALTL